MQNERQIFTIYLSLQVVKGALKQKYFISGLGNSVDTARDQFKKKKKRFVEKLILAKSYKRIYNFSSETKRQ